MRLVVWSLLCFVLGAMFLLPRVNPNWNMPIDYTTYGPIFIMLLSLVLQFEAMGQMRAKLKISDEAKKFAGIAEEKNELIQKIKEIQKQLAQAEQSHEEKMADTTQKLQAIKQEQKDLIQKHAHALKTAETEAAQKQALNILSLLQEKGRLIDFLMEDITPYNDTQISAAARIVHQGGAKLLKEYFDIQPVCKLQEGSPIELGDSDNPKEYKLLGAVRDVPPYRGTVLHRGWKTTKIELPQSAAKEPNLVLSPYEVELT